MAAKRNPTALTFLRTFTLIPHVLVVFFLFNCTLPALGGDSGPAIGEIAPEIGEYQWLQKDPRLPTKIAKLRGHVVLVHTFACGCDP